MDFMRTAEAGEQIGRSGAGVPTLIVEPKLHQNSGGNAWPLLGN